MKNILTGFCLLFIQVFSNAQTNCPLGQINQSDTVACSGARVMLSSSTNCQGVNNSTFTWQLLIPGSAFDGSKTNFSTTGYDRVNQTLYSVLKNGSTHSVYKFNLSSNQVSLLTSTGGPNELYQYTFDFVNQRIVACRSGRDAVYALPITGGNWQLIGNGGFDAESYGGTAYWNPISNRFGYFGGYGFFATKNWLWENNGSWVNTYGNNNNCQPAKRVGAQFALNRDGKKVYLFSSQGSCNGNQFASTCSLGSPWQTDVGQYCWLRDIWELNLENNQFVNVLPTNSPSITKEGSFSYDYTKNTFYIIGGFTPSAVYGTPSVFSMDVLRYRRDVDVEGFKQISVSGNPPPSNSNGISYYDSIGNRIIYARADGIWALNFTNDCNTQITWSTDETSPSISVTPTQTTTYYASFQNNNSVCRDSVTVFVQTTQQELIAADSIFHCGSSYTLMTDGEYTDYQWNNGGQFFSTTVNQSGWYVCTASNGDCPVTDSVYVSLINASIQQPDTSICINRSLSIGISGNAMLDQVRWSNGATGSTISVQPVSSTTLYAYLQQGANRCTDSIRIRVVNPASPTIRARACGQYRWNGITYTQSGTYTHQTTSRFGCDSTTTLQLTIDSVITDLFTEDTMAICGNATILTVPAGFDTYTWNNETSNREYSVSQSGLISCAVTRGSCLLLDSVYVSLSGQGIQNEDTTVCAGQLVVLSTLNSEGNNVPNYSLDFPNLAQYSGNAQAFCNSNLSGFDLTDNFTIEFWIKAEGPYYWHLMGKNTFGDNNRGWLLKKPGADMVLGWTYVPNEFGIHPFAFNNWEHVAICFNDLTNEFTYFKNGQLVSTQTINININPSPYQFLIGHELGTGNWFDGKMDNLRISNKVRYTGNFNPAQTFISDNFTVAMYGFNEGAGNVSYDLSGNERHLTLQNTLFSNDVPAGSSMSNTSFLWSNGATTPNITVTPAQTTTYFATITNGTNICTDSVTIHVNPAPNSTESLVACASYTWNGNTYSQSGTYVWTGSTSSGCDSTATLELTINNATSSTESVSACNSYSWNGNTYTQSGTYTWNGTNANGCDSTATLNLSIFPLTSPLFASDSISACGTQYTLSAFNGYSSYSWNTGAQTQSILVSNNGWYACTITNESGCSSTDSIYVSLFNVEINQPDTAICNGETLNLSVSNLETNNYSNIDLSNMQLLGQRDGHYYYLYNQLVNWEVANQIAQQRRGYLYITNSIEEHQFVYSKVPYKGRDGINYWLGLRQVKTASDFSEPAGGWYWVDGTPVTVNMWESFEPNNAMISSCPGQGEDYAQFEWDDDGIKWNDAPLCPANGFYQLEISYPIIEYNSDPTIPSQQILWSTGETTPSITVSPSQSSIYYATITSGGLSCTDSVTISVLPSSTSENTVSACNSYNWNGNAYTQSGTYTWSGTNANSCDSTATLELTINYATSSSESITACNSYRWNGNIYTQSGTYTYSTTNAAGCDSTATLNLTINYSSSSSEEVTACNSYSWNGNAYTQSGTYTWSGTNANSCDSTATLELTINYATSSTESITACNNYTWNGNAYTQSGTYTWNGTNVNGCDSTATLELTINNATSSNESITACNNYTWNGNTYTQSGTYTWSGTNANGCDSTATLELAITQLDANLFTQDSINVCGASYSLTAANGYDGYSWSTGSTSSTIHVASSGWYICTVNNGNCFGSDSVFVMINNVQILNRDTTICSGGSLSLSVNNDLRFTPVEIGSIVNFNWTTNPYYPIPFEIPRGNVEFVSIPFYIQPEGNNAWNAEFGNTNPSLQVNASNVKNVYFLVNTFWGPSGGQYSKMTFQFSDGTYFEKLLVSGEDCRDYLTNNWSNTINNTTTINALTIDQQKVDLMRVEVPAQFRTKRMNAISFLDYGGTSLHRLIITGVTIEANQASNILWSTGATTPSIIVSPTQTTTYITTVNNGTHACSDSVAITVLQPTSFTETINACDIYTWNGNTYTQSGTYTWRGTNANGCDSTATLELTINNATSSTESITACDSYNWNGNAYTQSGTYTWSGTNANGCDSTATLELTIQRLTAQLFDADTLYACGTQTNLSVASTESDLQYQWSTGSNESSIQVSQNGWYSVAISRGVCTSTDSIYVQLTQVRISPADTSICAGQSIQLQVDAPPVYTGGNGQREVILAPKSLYEYAFRPVSSNWNTTLGGWQQGLAPYGNVNNGDPDFNFNTFWPAGSPDGDDLFVRRSLDLTGYDLSSIRVDLGIDNGYTLFSNGQRIISEYAEGYTFRWEYPNREIPANSLNAGQNIIGVSLDDNGGLTAFDMQITGIRLNSTGQLLWSTGSTNTGVTVVPTQTTSYSVNYTSGNISCSDTVTITVLQPTSSTESITACDSYTWNGNTYTQSGTYTWNGTNANGCDSTATLELTINYATASTESITACDSYTWSGNAYTQSGTYTWMGTNATGCDSTATLELIIQTSSQSADSIRTSAIRVISGTPVQFMITGGSLGTGAQWVWYENACGGTPIAYGSAYSITPTAFNGIVTRTFYVRAEGICNQTNCVAMTLTIVPTCLPVSVTSSASNNTICKGNSTTLRVEGSLPAGATWRWYKNSCGASCVGSGSSLSIRPDCTTTYYVRAEGGVCGIGECRSITVTVNQIPATPGSISGPTTGLCGGTDLTYSISPVAGATSYTWNVPFGWTILSGQGTAQIRVRVGTSQLELPRLCSGEDNEKGLTICVKAVNACGSSASRCTSLNLLPTGSLSISGPEVACRSTNTTYTCNVVYGATQYSWTVPSGWLIVSGQGTSTLVVKAGNRKGEIKLKASNACGSGAETDRRVRSSRCENGNAVPDEPAYAGVGEEIKLWPVPATDQLNLQVTATWKSNRMEVLDAAGRVVMHTGFSTKLNVTRLRPGLYWLRIHTDQGPKTRRFEVMK
jgi:hypothetical protein